jgi:hypothetical protein
MFKVFLRKFLLRLPWDSWFRAVCENRSFDFHKRYVELGKLIKKMNHNKRVLDIGTSGKSPLYFLGFNVISLDVKAKKGVDIVASITALPFREHVFDVISCSATLEHIEHSYRHKAIQEVKRCGKTVIIYTPIHQPDSEFLAKLGDLLFLNYYQKIFRSIEPYTFEHLKNLHPTLDQLYHEGFKLLKPDFNLWSWLTFMKLYFRFRYGTFLHRLVNFITISLCTIFPILQPRPPYYGGFLVANESL